ncbi:MAG: Hsp20 family protein [Rhodobiaceae bacterium]|nr:Hsp20 family protein [Rhodobiaceae bacterium]
MRTFDFSPLYRSTVGFDRMASLLDAAASDEGNAYPPYNIERTGDAAYRITMAVAGFGENEVSIEAQQNKLTITGKKEAGDNDRAKFLHRGIATRSFQRQFELADYVEVKGAALENGLLHVDLAREIPEAMKPRTIAITQSPSGQPSIEGKVDSEAA